MTDSMFDVIPVTFDGAVHRQRSFDAACTMARDLSVGGGVVKVVDPRGQTSLFQQYFGGAAYADRCALRAPFAALRDILGDPADGEFEETLFEKTLACWFTRDAAGHEFRVWCGVSDEVDARSRERLLSTNTAWQMDLESDEAVVPSPDLASDLVRAAARSLSARVNARIKERSSLSDAGKAEVNRLIREGVPAPQAFLRSKHMSEPGVVSSEFHWPNGTRWAERD